MPCVIVIGPLPGNVSGVVVWLVHSRQIPSVVAVVSDWRGTYVVRVPPTEESLAWDLREQTGAALIDNRAKRIKFD